MDFERWLRVLALRWRSLFHRSSVERDLDDELRDHVERQTAENLARGMDPAAARTAALRAFGGVEFHKEQVRDTRGLRWLEELLQDLRYTQRTLRRAPSFALVVIATLALGIGSSTAVFSVVDGVLLRPLPYPRPDRLVQFWEVNPRGNHMQVADANFQDLVTRAHSFRALAEFGDYGVVPVSGGTVPVRAHAAIVSKDALLLATLGIYGVMAYVVTERRREIGVRLALGATGAGIVRLVVGQGARMAWLGIGIGIAIALAGMRALAGLLYGVSPLDPVAICAVVTLLAAVGTTASWVSARRAGGVSPVEVLRG